MNTARSSATTLYDYSHDIAYGLGFQKYLDGFGFTVEYIRFYDEDNVIVNNTDIGNVKVEGIVLGLMGYF